MIKLKKAKSSTWNGNGFGNETASWVVSGAEHIEIIKLGMDWFAIDRNTDKNLSTGWTKKECLDGLTI